MFNVVCERIERENLKENVWIVGPETARFLHLLVRSLAPKVVIEIGTSVGYSALWIADALRKNGEGVLWTVESHAGRFDRAQENIKEAGLELWIRSVKGHAPEIFAGPRFEVFRGKKVVDFVFLDATKMEHQSYIDALIPLLAPGAFLVVDNVQTHRFGLMHEFIQRMHSDSRFEVLELNLGAGLLLAKWALK